MSLTTLMPHFIQKFHSLGIWLRIFYGIFQNRRNHSYGPLEVKKAMDFYRITWKASLSDQLEAVKLIKSLSTLMSPKGSPIPLIRLGPENDAGYFTGEFGNNVSLITGGAGKNIDFEIAFAEKGATVVVYDPFVKELPKQHQNITHKRITLGKPRSKNAKFLDCKRLILNEESIFVNSNSILLKIDIEGSEYDFFENIGGELSIFDQVIIELHNLFLIQHLEFRNTLQNLIYALTKNHHVVATNINNNGILFAVGDSFFPEIIELTFLHHKYFSTKKRFAPPPSHINNTKRLPLSLSKLI